MQKSYVYTAKFLNKIRLICVLSLTLFLFACDVELYQGLDEKQANNMLVVLLENNIPAHKVSQGKAGYAVMVDENSLVRALDLLNNRNLPQEKYQSLGSVFSNEGLVSSSSAEKARMAYAISQELSDTFTRIDGVLSVRVHVVLAEQDQTGKVTVAPSAGIFIRYIPGSAVENYGKQLQTLTQKSIPNIKESDIAVVLIPVREHVSVPLVSPPTFMENFIQGSKESPLLMLMLGILSLAALVYLVRVLMSIVRNKKV